MIIEPILNENFDFLVKAFHPHEKGLYKIFIESYKINRLKFL